MALFLGKAGLLCILVLRMIPVSTATCVTNLGVGTCSSATYVDGIDTDGTFASNSNSKIPTQAAVKTYVDANSGGTATSWSYASVTYESGWSAYGSTNGVYYKKYANGHVQLAGMIARSSAFSDNNCIFALTLPTGFRPGYEVRGVATCGNDRVAMALVSSNGRIYFCGLVAPGCSNTWIGVSSISFYTDGP